MCGGKVGYGNVPNLAYDQGVQELDTSVCGCRTCSLAGARFRPLPASPRTLVCDPCSYSCRISALPNSIYVQMQKKVCTILLHLNRSKIIPRKICSEELIFRHVQDITLTENEKS